jgi:hypothetical protein
VFEQARVFEMRHNIERVEPDGSFKLFSRLVAILRNGGQATAKHGAEDGGVRVKIDRATQPKDGLNVVLYRNTDLRIFQAFVGQQLGRWKALPGLMRPGPRIVGFLRVVILKRPVFHGKRIHERLQAWSPIRVIHMAIRVELPCELIKSAFDLGTRRVCPNP